MLSCERPVRSGESCTDREDRCDSNTGATPCGDITRDSTRDVVEAVGLERLTGLAGATGWTRDMEEEFALEKGLEGVGLEGRTAATAGAAGETGGEASEETVVVAAARPCWETPRGTAWGVVLFLAVFKIGEDTDNMDTRDEVGVVALTKASASNTWFFFQKKSIHPFQSFPL